MSNVITSGMDIGQVRALAGDLNRAADDISRLAQQIAAKLHSVPWAGPDRQRFESDWTAQHAPQLRTVEQALRDAARIATTNAQEQESTSSR